MIATQPYKEAHFATFPPTLIEPMIRAGTSERGCCPECGAPWERVVERTDDPDTTAKGSRFDKGKTGARDGGDRTQPGERYRKRAVGWRPGCSCPDHEPAPCTVLDPFIGSGTTAVVSVQHGRRCIGIELNPEYVKMAEKRIASSAVGVDSAPEHGRISGEQAGEKSLPLPLPFGG
ncbi:MAG: Modification methylase DpnIIB [candidate division WS2 bacterium]|nr:Modification methylase DpnIIB [Candidatus Psychracetigena formicireducens]